MSYKRSYADIHITHFEIYSLSVAVNRARPHGSVGNMRALHQRQGKKRDREENCDGNPRFVERLR